MSYLKSFIRSALITLIISIYLPSIAKSQEYNVTLIASSIANPELGHINAALATPVIEGDWVVFRTLNNVSNISFIWSWNIKTRQFVKLVDLTMAAPGGTGNFTELGAGLGGPYLKDGIVIFGARDQGTPPSPALNTGIFSVPVSGGAIQRIANYNTAVPGGTGNFFSFGGISGHTGNFSFSDGIVGIEGEFGGGPIGNSGIYQSDIAGGNMQPIADSLHGIGNLFPITNFTHVSVHSNRAAFIGGNVFGYQALYSTNLPASLPSYNELIRVDSVLPGALGGFQFALPSVRMFNDSVFFIALDSVPGGNNNRRALYEIPFAGGSPKKIISNHDSLEGLSSIEQSSINSYDINNSNLLIRAKAPGSTNQQGLYLYNMATEAFTRIFRIDQQILDRNFGAISEVQPGSISADSSAVVVAISGSALFVGPYTYIVLLTKDALVTATPTPESPGGDISQITQQAMQTVDSIRVALESARKKLPAKPSKSVPKKKRQKINKNRKAIQESRKLVSNLLNTLKALEQSSGAAIRTAHPNFNSTNILALEDLLKTGSSSKTKAKNAKKAWQSFSDTLSSVI